MSKHNHHNRQPQQVAAPAAAETKAVDTPEVTTPVEPVTPPPEQPVEKKTEEVVTVADAPVAAEAPKEEPPAPKPVAAPAPEVKKPETVRTFTKPTEKITSADVMTPKGSENNLFARRRAMNAAATPHTLPGKKLIQLFDAYAARMAVPSKDKEENRLRIKMLQDIVAVACPQNPMDLQTATDVARVMFDKLMDGWGTIYTDATIFRMGETLKGTSYDLDKMVMFIEAYIQLIEGAVDKRPVMFNEDRLGKVLKNPNMVIAMARIKDNINLRNGFKH